MSNPFNPYQGLFDAPTGVGDQRPTAFQVIEDQGVIGSSYAGKVALVTGGTSGIGLETVRALHATGADVYFTARDVTKGETVRRDILSNSKGIGALGVIFMDMDSLESVRDAAKTFLEKSGKLNILVNNAGIMATPYSHTNEGFERQFGVNHLAHFLLTVLLLPTLESSVTPALASRVINVSSSSHRFALVNFEHWNSNPVIYNGQVAYGQSKTANIWMANYLDRVYGPRGVHSLSLGPGGIWTGLTAYTAPDLIEAYKSNPTVVQNMRSAEQGAATTLWAAVGKPWEGKGGEYLHDCTVAPLERGDMYTAMSPCAAPWAKGWIEDEDRLWKLSEKLVNIKSP
ncbi:hypothetical protein FQN52_000720 [Onygenales sp. PD_12]|nr:hypothetical protein FQN53_003247 [Emmonsiellopsis sp. PD_33]KAK2793768.1 hypothetical protein FQN52_000720 [Onygenales sp. PD_12]